MDQWPECQSNCPSGHSVNPDLLFVLEQTKSCWFPTPISIKNNNQHKSDPEKLHCKLVFDLVNELLLQKIKLINGEPQSQLLHRGTTAKFCNGQWPLKELRAEIEQLKAKSSSAASCNDDAIST